jgi:hypothetical protein
LLEFEEILAICTLLLLTLIYLFYIKYPYNVEQKKGMNKDKSTPKYQALKQKIRQVFDNK